VLSERALTPFRFIDPGPLVDGELELVAPDARHVDDLLAASAHPLSRADPQSPVYTREKVAEFLRAAPAGHQPAHAAAYGSAPVYHFWMRLAPAGDARARVAGALPAWGTADPPVRVAGTIGLRIGTTRDLELYYGHVGYNVFPPARGNRYAARACRLVLPVARAHGIKHLWITCNPDNHASRRTCERIGAALIDVVAIPPGHSLYLRGEREKCRYRLEL
jgi:tagatose 1,6-diphosphate aldolase